jgi:hypothetical protein
MNHTVQPLQFDVRKLIAKGRRILNKRVTGAQIRLPGFTFTVAPVDPEVKLARQLVVWLGDRRVLNSFECCDGCIDRSLASLLKIREHLVQRQVELADLSDGVLFFLIEFIVQGLRQFLTHEERLKAEFGDECPSPHPSDFHRSQLLREHYFAALKTLRAHISGAAEQIAAIAGISLPCIPDYLRVQSWDNSNYITE